MSGRRGLHVYLPGPRGLPLFGNLLDVPMQKQWLKFAEMGDVWGDISSLIVLGKTIIIVNSVKVAEDLLDIRGANFSDRPVFPMGGELAGFSNALPLAQYGDRVRKERKLLHQLFGTQGAIQQFHSLLSLEVHKLLRNVVMNPEGILDEIGRSLGAITLRIAYGYHLREGPDKDPFLQEFETAGHNFVKSTTPGAFLVDIIPVFRYWPEWLPGGSFHTTARAWSKQNNDNVNAGLEYVKNAMAAGTAEPSFLSTLLEAKSHDEHLIKWAAATIEAGGSETTAAQLEAFILAMVLHPDVQATAQRELDKLVGNDRLPDISDRSQLPYVDALCKEVLRWHVSTPLGIPHRAREDCVYDRGRDLEPLRIPKNSLIIPNMWKMTRDPERYRNPTVFDPSRFIPTDRKEAEQDPASICFGICPGKLLGEAAIFLVCSSILSVFNISKVRENGVLVEPLVDQTSGGAVSHIVPFKCSVNPRSARAMALIQSSGSV
ncbi:Cytochrome p450 [Mycena sanguinolenta]|uniref:Cytochrome p450 n=1 Tax=Mycena sanguinolenta TaxID=230812 RepID=A0A8H6ZJK5_9AGAR|nr:Cytochrome p450 [Mycena sanguinolenta]